MLKLTPAEEPESLADWVEASILARTPPERISDAAIMDALNESGRDADEGHEHILQQFRLRQHAMGPTYPIVRDGQGFRASDGWESHLCYSFLLFVSLNQSYQELNYGGGAAHTPAMLFEKVTARALEAFVGGRAIRLGAPRHDPVPNNFPDAIDYLVEEINEPAGARDLELHASGDDGLDIWLAKSLGDGRASQLFILAQCAIGRDWQGKRSDLDLARWKRHVDWYTTPQKAFAVPFQITADSWRETATTGGLVFDRPRIARLVNAADLAANVRRRMTTWTRQRIRQTLRTIAG